MNDSGISKIGAIIVMRIYSLKAHTAGKECNQEEEFVIGGNRMHVKQNETSNDRKESNRSRRNDECKLSVIKSELNGS